MEVGRLGKYEVRAKIGQGAMGEVYRGYDPVLQRDVAIKTISARAGSDTEIRERFKREAREAARLNHPNVITIHDFGEEQGLLYMAMELLDGSDLKTLIARGKLTLPVKIDLIGQICDGLAFAHAKGLVHRDLKPANIHVTSSGQAKVLDFGLARIATSDMTRTGIIMGTPNYMSPEQVRGEKASARSDVFSLGSVFYELLGGRRAFEAENIHGVLFQVLDAVPEPLEAVAPEVPLALRHVVEKAMRKDAAARFADAGEMRRAVQEVRAVLSARPESGLPAPAASGSQSAAETRTRVGTPSPFTKGATALEPASGETISAEAPPTLSAAAPTQVLARPSKTGRVAQVEEPRARTVVRAPPPRRRIPLPFLLAGPIVAVGGAYFLLLPPRRPEPAPPPTPAVETSPSADPLARSVAALMERAQRSLEDRDPRTAGALAEEALRADPTNAPAQKLLREVKGRMREVEAALQQMDAGLAVGDSDRASRALARVVAHDPRNPAVAAFDERLNAALKARAEQMRREAERAQRVTPGPPRAAPAPAPTLAAVASPPPLPAASLAPPTPLPAPVVLATPPPNPAQLEAASRQAIRGVLDEYRGAFESRNADALRAVQPGVDYEEMKSTFARVTAFNVKLQIQSIGVTGNTATVSALVSYNLVPKPAGKIAPVPTVFHLRKTGELWVIERVSRR